MPRLVIGKAKDFCLLLIDSRGITTLPFSLAVERESGARKP
jgi:hypothetical protein